MSATEWADLVLDTVAGWQVEEFFKRVEKTEGCWIWTAGVSGTNHGRFWTGERHVPAHRFSYEYARGPVPAELYMDHLCRNPRCVNPDHLEPVTPRTNVLRGTSMVAGNAGKTHCKRGHEYTPENTHRDKRGRRSCKECHRLLAASRRAAKRQEDGDGAP
ncbi:HNH endonuclease signature motif containing protein [Nonomuraea sp. NPDC003804]|uniref:HNH endonuclease signature motif containing protein n=1 Tax=Nonomuraea sp. NPDC003804 TaxID=3154547 RepID=UPI0033B10607